MPEATSSTTPAVSSAAPPAAASGYSQMDADLDNIDVTADASSDTSEETPGEVSPPAAEPAADELEAEPEEPEGDLAAEEETEAPAEEVPPATPGEELPEGVTVRDRNGKKEYVLKESRYRKFHQAHVAMREAEKIFGEPMTSDVAQAYHQAYVSQETMLGDYLSGDPTLEDRFLGQLAHWSHAAQKTGEVRHNPLRSLFSKLPEFLNRIGDKETLQTISDPIVQARLQGLVKIGQTRAAAGDKNLIYSLQHVHDALFGKYPTEAQLLAPPDLLAEREAALAEREARLGSYDARQAQNELRAWESEAKGVATTAIDGEISSLLKPAETFYKSFPREFAGVKKLLREGFEADVAKDSKFQLKIQAAYRRVKATNDPRVRDSIKEDLGKVVAAKAKMYFDPENNSEVREILSQRAGAIKAQSQANHQRLQNGAARRAPGTVGTPAPQQIRQGKSNAFAGTKAWEDAVDRVLA